MRLAEQTKIVPLIAPADYNASGKDSDSFSMENYGHATILLIFGTLVANSDLVVYEGAAVGEKTTEINFSYRWTSAVIEAAADADKLVAEVKTTVAATGLELTGASYANFMLVIEIDDSELTDGYPWITLAIDGDATTLFMSAVAILSQPRYAQNVPPTAIV